MGFAYRMSTPHSGRLTTASGIEKSVLVRHVHALSVAVCSRRVGF